MLKLFLWLKNLRRKKIVLLSITAVALACALLIVVASIFSGYIRSVQGVGREFFGDIVIWPPRMPHYEEFTNELSKLPQVRAATPVLFGNGLLHLGPGNVRAVNVMGIDAAGQNRVNNLKSYLLREKSLPSEPTFTDGNDANTPGIFIGIALITEPNDRTDEYDFAAAKAIIGKTVVLTSGRLAPVQDTNAAGPRLRARTIAFKVADVMFTGFYEWDTHTIYVPIDVLQAKLFPGEEPKTDMIQIALSDPSQAQAALPVIQSAFEQFARTRLGWPESLVGEAQIQTAQEIQGRFIAELKKQMALLLVIFGAASLGAILLIFCIFYMIVISKRKDIGILKACGTSNTSIALLFISYGIFIGVAGAILGGVIGYYFIRNINVIENGISYIFGFKIWKSSVYMFSKIPNQLDLHAAMWIMAAAVAAAAIGALIPAIAAARMRPVRILRYE